MNMKYQLTDFSNKLVKVQEIRIIYLRYAAYLKTSNNISNLTLKQRVVTVKNFLEYHDVNISPRKFKLKVKLPKIVKRNKEALSKEDVAAFNASPRKRKRKWTLMMNLAQIYNIHTRLEVERERNSKDPVTRFMYVCMNENF